MKKHYVRPDGTTRWVRNNVSLVPDAQGTPEFITAISVDINHEKEAQLKLARQAERQSLVVNELNHRVRNTPTTVQALAAQIVRRDQSNPEQVYQAFVGRLMALAKAHDVLTREQWIEADLSGCGRRSCLPLPGQPDAHRGGGPFASRLPETGPCLVHGAARARHTRDEVWRPEFCQRARDCLMDDG
ncbi:HWE histidine kinase domain-containing protein [Methylobacterium adhaesivum]|uniref:HWE histidine kinase domain-containing protein n=1 Tax=Methylobacterium adhaesivum TaxID=333297 RepID=UPI00338E7602